MGAQQRSKLSPKILLTRNFTFHTISEAHGEDFLPEQEETPGKTPQAPERLLRKLTSKSVNKQKENPCRNVYLCKELR